MTTSCSNVGLKNRTKRVVQPQVATLIVLSTVTLTSLVMVGWFTGHGVVTSIFSHFHIIQENPPIWLEVPMVAREYLFAPSVLLLLTVLVIMWISPQPVMWSRVGVVSILLALTIRYVLWRSLSTLNFSSPLDGLISLALFLLEMLMLASNTLQLFLMVNVKNRHQEADQHSIAVLEGRFTPSVDVLIPTYNEPTFILRRTVIGCQVLEYSNKKIYLLDDTHRPEVRALAVELGCEYVTRPDNRHAKAGNLNHAITKTNGELLVVFDADFVPTKNFLTRTVGFFQDPQVALVQTPQSFYNADPIARNLGLESILTPEEEVFYRQIQPIRDAAGSVICAGTSFITRREALVAVGGFVTETLSEDYFTGIRLSAKGYQLIYLDEKLSAGLAAENMAAHAIQRLRWAQGTMQAFFIEANPLTIPGLCLRQRLAHLEGLLHWFTSISRVGFLLIPLAYSFLRIIPVRATTAELLYFFLPYYLVQLTVFSWLNYRSRSALLSDIYSLVLSFPLALTVIQSLLNPFSQDFRVTPKGTSSDRFTFNWNLALPLILLFLATAVSLWVNLRICMLEGTWQPTIAPEVADQVLGIGLGWIWSGYNLLMIGIALLILLDVPKQHVHEWFELRRVVRLTVDDGRAFWGITTKISEVGAEVALTQAGFPPFQSPQTRMTLDTLPVQAGTRYGATAKQDENQSFSCTPPIPYSNPAMPIYLEMMEERIFLPGEVTYTGFNGEFPTVQITFKQTSLEQCRRLVELLFCRPGQWKTRQTPSEFQSLCLLFKVLLRPCALFSRNPRKRAIAVTQI